MSVVTNFIVICAHNDHGGAQLASRFHPIHFNQIDGVAGGNKVLELDIWAAAVNYTRVEGITVDAILKLAWEYPDELLVLVQEQHEKRPSIWERGPDNNPVLLVRAEAD